MSFFLIPGLVQSPTLLTDPILQNPSLDSVHIVWFTEFAGVEHYVEYGEQLLKKVGSQTKQLSRMRQDLPNDAGCIDRLIYRHEAIVTGLSHSSPTPYRVVSITAQSEIIASAIFSCSPAPTTGSVLKILLTSDHQVKSMVAANLQKVKETIPDIDAIFFAGDAVDYPDKASQWFDDPSGSSFFPCLQGRASGKIGNTFFRGGSLLQNAPIFCAIGNHDVMGRFNRNESLDKQFNDAVPKGSAQGAKKDHSFNTISYEEIFTFPTSASGNNPYYAVTFGDIRLVVLYATRPWRTPHLGAKSKYTEIPESFDKPSEWGYGDFIFEPLDKGSDQYVWLEKELTSDVFQMAKYKIVMLHNPLHSLGTNASPPFAYPIQRIEKNAEGKILSIQYHYPKDQDVLIRDIEPLLMRYGVQLVFYGHSHLWNRFESREGMHYLESSNVGNSHGAYVDAKRKVLPGYEDEDYVASGDPNGLSPIVPTLAPLYDVQGNPLPFISSNHFTVFSILSTDTGFIDSYYFDTTKPDSGVVHFDRFFLKTKKAF